MERRDFVRLAAAGVLAGPALLTAPATAAPVAATGGALTLDQLIAFRDELRRSDPYRLYLTNDEFERLRSLFHEVIGETPTLGGLEVIEIEREAE